MLDVKNWGRDEREHLIHHAAFKVHEASGCGCGMDNPPSIEVDRARLVVDTVEPYIREAQAAEDIARIRAYAAKLGDIDQAARHALEDMARLLENDGPGPL